MNIALILSGGTGTRVGADIPKQYIEVEGRPILFYCVETLSECPKIDAIQIVADSEWQEQIRQGLSRYDCQKKFRGFSLPGENRQLSIFHGLEDIRKFADDTDSVLVHDAARPLLSKKQIETCMNALPGHEGVLPVLPLKDTVYCSVDGKQVSSLLNRNEVYAGQAPEVFLLEKYYEANKYLLPEKILQINGSTEPAIMAGMDVVMVPGDERNFKITTKSDLEDFSKICQRVRRG